MKIPKLIMQDPCGVRNEDLEVSINQFTETGLWKHQRIVVIIPASAMIPARVMLAQAGLVFPPNNRVARIMAMDYEVGHGYSEAIDSVLAHPVLNEWEYILTMEHDNCPPPLGVIQLLVAMDARKDLHAIGGLYWIKGEGGMPQIWGDITDPIQNFRPVPPVPNKIVECWGVAMGFTLFRMSMFKEGKLPRPFFKTNNGLNTPSSNGVFGMSTQDMSFWMEASKHGYKCGVDCSVKVGHYEKERDIIW